MPAKEQEPKQQLGAASVPPAGEDTYVGIPGVKHKIAKRVNIGGEYVGDDDPVARLTDDAPELKRFYLVMNDEHERAIAEQWMAANAPEVPHMNLVDELHLNEMRHDSTVFVLMRHGTSRRPPSDAQPITGRNDQGHLIHETADSKRLAAEMDAYGPIELKDYWQARGAGRWSVGTVDRTRLLDAINELTMPRACARLADIHEVRNNAPAQLVRLFHV